jgi:integrase
VRGFLRHRHSGPCGKRCTNPASWEVRVYAGLDPITKRKRYVSRTVKGKRNAEDLRNRLLVDVADGHHTGAAMTLAELCQRWLAHASPDLAPYTASNAAGLLRWHVLPHLGDRQITKLRARDLDKLYARLRERGGRCRVCWARARQDLPPLAASERYAHRPRRDRVQTVARVHLPDCATGLPLAASSVRRVHGLLATVLAQAVRWELLAANPAASATPPRQGPGRITPPTPEQLAELLAAAADADADFAFYLILDAVTGARRAELLALRWSAVDLERGQVAFRTQIVDRGAGRLEERPPKTGQGRRIAVDEATVAVLRTHRGQQRERALACGIHLPAGALLFARDPAGAVPWRPDTTSHRFTRLAREAGLEGVRLHDLRHFVATQLLGAGVNVRTAAARLGHLSPDMTLRVYADALAAPDQQAAALLAGLVLGSGKQAGQGVYRPIRDAKLPGIGTGQQ